jgi:simple sugar transport system ATP-binding protein
MDVQLSTKDISKKFGRVVANDRITLSFTGGNIYSILGENGSGKTTYLSILFGIHKADEGEILLGRDSLKLKSPKEAITHRIYLVQQTFSLIESFSVAENLALMDRPSLNPLNLREVASRAQAAAEKMGFRIDPEMVVEKTPMNYRQRLEILKGLLYDARILLLDEPTAVLTPQQTEDLGKILRSLASEGRIIIFTSHKLEQVIRFSDYITVLRAGRVVASLRTRDVKDVQELAAWMVGEDFVRGLPRKEIPKENAILRVDNLEVKDDKGRMQVDAVSFTVKEGEILGLAGVARNGQKELVEAIVGLTTPSNGCITFNGSNSTGWGAGKIRRNGVGYIPEEGALVGIVPDFSVAENLSMTTYDLDTNSLLLGTNPMSERADRLVREYDIRPPNRELPAKTLSGGNAQKVIVARELSRPVRLLVAYNATKGLDVKATTLVQRKFLEKRNSGTAVLLVSEDLEEILALSDRIAVMYEGRIVDTREAGKANIQDIGRLMAGGMNGGTDVMASPTAGDVT